MKLDYRPEIDGLRALAVTAVIFYHAGLMIAESSPLAGGYLGVDIFFVISGYLITRILLHSIDAGNFSFTGFYERRARRILPVLFTVLICTLPFAYLLLLPWQIVDYTHSLIATLAFISNIYFWNQSGYFAETAEHIPLLHTWSLSIEEQFYIFFPPLLLLLHKYRHKSILKVLTMILVVSLVLAEYLSRHQPETAFYLLPSRMWELLAGAVLAKLETDRPYSHSVIKTSWLPMLGIALIIGSMLFFNEGTRHPGFISIPVIAGTMLIIRYSGKRDPIGRLLSLRPIVWVGLISYSLYLWHFPVLVFAKFYDPELSMPGTAGCLLLTLILSIASYHFIERPFRNKKTSLVQLGRFCSACLILSIAFVFPALRTAGAFNRYSPEELPLVNYDRDELTHYVSKRFNEHRLRDFIPDNKRKLLIIGDSYAQDIVNALAESGLIENVQLSTFHISRRCGNLLVTGDISGEIEPKYQSMCASAEGYRSPELIKLIREADTIWLSSSWVDWQARLLPESLANIRKLTDASVLVIGRKNFGAFSVNQLLDIPDEIRYTQKTRVSDSHWNTNEYMRSVLPSTVFVDLHTLVCGRIKLCPLFDNEAKWISFDGNHLTKYGAMYIGNLLKKHPLIIDSLRIPHSP